MDGAMICVVIYGPTFEDAARQIVQASPYADIVELRLDQFERLDLEAIQQLRLHCPCPMLFTLRGLRRLHDLYHLASLQPEYLDIEYDLPRDAIREIMSQYP